MLQPLLKSSVGEKDAFSNLPWDATPFLIAGSLLSETHKKESTEHGRCVLGKNNNPKADLMLLALCGNEALFTLLHLTQGDERSRSAVL